MWRIAGMLTLCGVAAAFAALAGELPVDPSVVHERLGRWPNALPAAMALAEQHTGGRVFSARLVGTGPQVEVLVATAEGLNIAVQIDVERSEILSSEKRGRFPGWVVKGPGVESPTGLRTYEVTSGDGLALNAKDAHVQVHYTGYLVDGTRFESSRDQGSPVVFRLDQVIPGWTEGLLGMKVGGRRKLIIPPELGYGEMGSPPVIPPDAVLIFDVELLALP